MKLVAKSKGKVKLISKKASGKKSPLLIAKKGKKSGRGGSRERSGRFSIFRPKVRGRAYPVQDNVEGWKLFDRLVKQAGISGSDIYTLGMRLLAREFGPTLTKATAIALGKRLSETEFKFAEK